ncbi:F-box/kelch-repeat protein [Hibiscus syriacus]|uniref:F-box/kelch-repeat protein n=1 Tax=Hibiscus syriacus TaxID=106335 RepID=A0A6A3C6T7_HIBSY|nr:F-box/kelch-repeat protein [Hibiscus syriacus]
MEQSISQHSSNALRGFRVQAPLVDSVYCYCKVDSGLKTVAEARKFVPGSKLCIQPDINPNAHKSRSSRRERTRVQPPLLPEEWVYIFKRDHDGKISWNAFDPINQLWQPLPPVPREYSEALGFGCAVLSDMSTAMVPFIGIVYDGKCVSLNGQLYALDCRDGCKLRVYDGATDSWNKFIDSKLHLGSSRALEAAALIHLKGKLCIIRNNMSISLVDISSPDKQVESNPQLWENIGGRGLSCLGSRVSNVHSLILTVTKQGRGLTKNVLGIDFKK